MLAGQGSMFAGILTGKIIETAFAVDKKKL